MSTDIDGSPTLILGERQARLIADVFVVLGRRRTIEEAELLERIFSTFPDIRAEIEPWS